MSSGDKVTGGVAMVLMFLGGITGVLLLDGIGLVLGLGTIANATLAPQKGKHR